MRIPVATTWILIGFFLMCMAVVSFEKALRGYTDYVEVLNLLTLIIFFFGSAIIFSGTKMIRGRSKNPIGLKIASWIFILYGVSFVLFGGFDDTGIFYTLIVLLLVAISTATLVLLKRAQKPEMM